MDLRSLVTIKAILTEGSFQKAAQRLNYTQSAVTFQVRQLENELSLKLFERIGRRMVLTQAGRDILPHIESIMQSMQEIQWYGQGRRELSGDLRVSLAESLLSYKMRDILTKFVEMAPKVRLTLSCLNFNESNNRLLSGDLDLGVCYDMRGIPGSLKTVHLCDFETVIMASPSMPEELRDFDSPDQEKDVSFVTNEPDSIYREQMEHHLKAKNIVIRNIIELWSVEGIKKSVAANMGFSFMPRFVFKRELEEKTLVEIPTAMPERRVTAICMHHRNKELSRSMELFMDLVMNSEAFTEKPGGPRRD